jgi:DedD protein
LADSEDAIVLQRRARRRLVGAIALVVFTVIVLPVVFDKEPRSKSQDLVIQIPSQDTGRFNSRIVPAATEFATAAPSPGDSSQPKSTSAANAASQGAEAPAAVSRPDERTRGGANAQSTGARAEVKAAKATPADSGKPRSPAAEEERFVVVLGTYSSRDNVKQLQARASGAGFKTFTEALKVPKGSQWRVRAGPYSTREAAEHARERMKARGLPTGTILRQES